jgi:lipopolysaccharide export system protein LptA
MSQIGGRRKALVASSIVLGVSVCLSGAASAPARAQTPGSGLATSYSANADKPIDIEADVLEVDDKKKVAVFKGNVSATQGDFNLRASEIEVTYTDSNKAAGAAKPQPVKEAAASPVPGAGSIKQINAKGKVLVTGKDNQTATSDWAIFEVEKQLITLGGHHQGQPPGDRYQHRADPRRAGRRRR